MAGFFVASLVAPGRRSPRRGVIVTGYPDESRRSTAAGAGAFVPAAQAREHGTAFTTCPPRATVANGVSGDNAAQGSDVIDFLRTRRERQDDARKQIASALADYNVVAVDTLIGDITPPDALMTTLTDRKLAEQEKVTYDTQRLAEETRKELQQAKAMADTQASVVAAERQVQIQAFQAGCGGEDRRRAGRFKEAGCGWRGVCDPGHGKCRRRKDQGGRHRGSGCHQTQDRVDGFRQLRRHRDLQGAASSGFKLVPDVVVSGNGGSGPDGGNSLVSVLLANLIRDGRDKHSAQTAARARAGKSGRDSQRLNCTGR